MLLYGESQSFHLSQLWKLCSYYGLTVWFPDMIKYIQKQEYESRTKTFTKERVEHVTFNFTLENQVHRQGYYFNDKWATVLKILRMNDNSNTSILNDLKPKTWKYAMCFPDSLTWRWSPWCLKILCLRSATSRTSHPHTPSSETAPSLPVYFITQVNIIRNQLCLQH